MSKPVVVSAALAKSHIAGFTRKDGTFVKEHDDSRQAAAPKPVSQKAVGDKVYYPHPHKPGQKAMGTVVGHEDGKAIVKHAHSDHVGPQDHGDLRVHQKADLRARQDAGAKKTQEAFQQKAAEHAYKTSSPSGGESSHPMVVGKAENLQGGGADEAHGMSFAGKQFLASGKTGTSNHDDTPVRHFKEQTGSGEDDGQHVWMDHGGNVHADSTSEVKGLRADYEKHKGASAAPAKPKQGAAPASGGDSPAGDANEASWDAGDDEKNPRHALSGLSSKSLGQLASGKVNAKDHAHHELANRGVDSAGKWVGHSAAAEHHGKSMTQGFQPHGEVADHLQTVHHSVLTAAAKGHLDLKKRAGAELAKRGHDHDGGWVGFDAAKKLHGGSDLKKSMVLVSSDLMKAHVAGFTRKDGTFVKDHDDGRAAAAQKSSGLSHSEPVVAGKTAYAKFNAAEGEHHGDFRPRRSMESDGASHQKKFLESQGFKLVDESHEGGSSHSSEKSVGKHTQHFYHAKTKSFASVTHVHTRMPAGSVSRDSHVTLTRSHGGSAQTEKASAAAKG